MMERVYNTVFRNDSSMRDFIDFQVCKNCKLRMAFSDKWDRTTGGEAGRKLKYFGAYNNNGVAGKRYFPDFAGVSRMFMECPSVPRLTSCALCLVSQMFMEFPEVVLVGGTFQHVISWVFRDPLGRDLHNFVPLRTQIFSEICS